MPRAHFPPFGAVFDIKYVHERGFTLSSCKGTAESRDFERHPPFADARVGSAAFFSLRKYLRAYILKQFSHSLFFDKPLIAANRGLIPKSAIFGNASDYLGSRKPRREAPAVFRDPRGNPNARRNKATMCVRRVSLAAQRICACCSFFPKISHRCARCDFWEPCFCPRYLGARNVYNRGHSPFP